MTEMRFKVSLKVESPLIFIGDGRKTCRLKDSKKRVVVVEDPRWIKFWKVIFRFSEVILRLEILKTHWGYKFRFGVFEIPRGDFELIAAAMGLGLPNS